jgi:hypothetical protein
MKFINIHIRDKWCSEQGKRITLYLFYFLLLFPSSPFCSLCLLAGSGGNVCSSTSGGRSFIIDSLYGSVDFPACCSSVLRVSCVRHACGARALLMTFGVNAACYICSGVGAVTSFFNLLSFSLICLTRRISFSV